MGMLYKQLSILQYVGESVHHVMWDMSDESYI